MKIIAAKHTLNEIQIKPNEPEIPFNQEYFDAQQKQLVDKFIKNCSEQNRLRKEMTDTCQICYDNEATEQLPNESGLYVCYGCKVAQREVI